MKYEKPQVHVISRATKAIETIQEKVPSLQIDSATQMNDGFSGPGYEADE
jgi:hypothetical protein